MDPENEKKFTQRLKETKRISPGKIRGDRAWRGISFKKLNDAGTEGTDGTAKGGLYPLNNFQNDSKNIEESKHVSQVSLVSSSRFCSIECSNFHKVECPLFLNKLDEKTELPLKCYGFKAPNPGHFSLTKTQEQILIEFNRVSDSVTAFQMENGVYNKNFSTTRAETLTAYQEYCEAIGVEVRKASQLTQGMQRLAPKVKDGWIYKPKKERAWLGFGLKDREQQSIEQMEQIEQQYILSSFSNSKIIKDKITVPTVPSVPNLNPEVTKTLECGECYNFHKPECSFPHGIRSNLQGYVSLIFGQTPNLKHTGLVAHDPSILQR